MRNKLLLFGLLCLVCVGGNQVFDLLLIQPVSAAAAVAQVEDSEAGAVAVRSVGGVSNMFHTITWGLTAMAGILMFWKDLAALVKYETFENLYKGESK